jgi:hypothetical protein
VGGRRADLVREAKDRALRLGNRVLQGTQPDISGRERIRDPHEVPVHFSNRYRIQ